jgi:hypothetical protein
LKFTAKQEEAQAILSGDATHNLLVGGSRCFVASQLVITLDGPTEISTIKPGQLVLSMNEKLERLEYQPVNEVHEYKSNTKPMIKLRLKNGLEIIGTEDHEIYFNGGWHPLKYVLECVHGRMA